MSSSRLFDLPGDAMDVICEHLDGADVAALLGTGCLVLRQKVLAAAHNLRCQRSGFSGFPFSLYKLPQLRSLDVSIVKHQFGDHPLRLGGNLPLPRSPAPSLTSLRLSFAQSFRVLDESAPDLNTLLPHITELHLTEARTLWTTEYLRKLPQTLRKLSLLSSASFREQPDIKYPSGLVELEIADLSLLPPFLEELSLFCVGENWNWKSGILWPVGLRKLVMLDLYDSGMIFHHLPHTLEHLEIEFKASRVFTGVEELVPLSVLPPTLRVFKVKSKMLRVNLGGSAMPPNIEVWEARTNWESLFVNTKVEDMEIVMKAYLPSTLKKVELGGSDEYWQSEYKHASILCSLLPLQSMERRQLPLENASLLPRTLTRLESAIETSEQVMALPSVSLVHFRLYKPNVPLLPSAWSFLGSFLHTLIIYAASNLNTKELLASLFKVDETTSSHLPLTHLELTYPGGFCTDIALYLPTNLTTLRVTIPAELGDTAICNAIAQMSSKLPNLKTLAILNYFGQAHKKRKLKFIPHLPRSITSFMITFDHLKADPKLMRLLPPNLTSLNMATFGGNAGFSMEHFTHLPKTLTELSLNYVVKDTGAPFWNQLPPHIHTIHAYPRGAGYLQAKRDYYSRPDWEV